MNKNKINRKGISLIEIILTVGIFAMIIPLIYSIFFVGNKSFGTSRDIGLAQQEARLVSQHLENELRNVSKINNKKDENLPERYFTIAVDKNDGISTLKKVEHNIDGTIGTKLTSGNWDINLANNNGIIMGVISVYIDKDTDYELPINIPLENDKGASFAEMTLSNVNQIYYGLSEDTYDSSIDDEKESDQPGEVTDPDESKPEESNKDNWSSTTVYNKGDEIWYQGSKFVARYYTEGDIPGRDNSPWQEITDQWRSFNIYAQDDEVWYEGSKYRAKYYTKGDKPSNINGPWEKIF